MRKPKYRKHSSRDKGFVEFRGQRIYFDGRHNSPESLTAYKAFCSSLESPAAPASRSVKMTLGDLAVLFLDHAHEVYPHKGQTGTYFDLRRAIRYVTSGKHMGWQNLLADEFGPLKLKELQSYLVQRGLSRVYINDTISRIRTWVKWCVSEQLVDVTTLQSLKTVDGLRKGRSKAVEYPPRKPAAWEDVQPCLAYLQPVTRAMLMVQWYTGARSDSICMAKPEQFDTSDEAWVWRPRHKTEHHGHDAILYVGLRCQHYLLPFMRRKPSDFLFNPREWHNGKNRRYNKHYSRYSYRTALVRAQDAAIEEAGRQGVHPPQKWTPHQLRHARGTLVRERWGLEAAQAVLSHANIQATQVYAERRLALAKQIALAEG